MPFLRILFLLVFASTIAHAAVHKPVRRPAALSVEQKSPFSLEGKSYMHVTKAARLTRDDAALYAHIFAVQDVGAYKKANDDIEKLSDHRLMGHALYQRFTNRDYKPTYAELCSWLRDYGDHPGAQKIFIMAQNRQKKGAAPPVPPRQKKGMTAYHDLDAGERPVGLIDAVMKKVRIVTPVRREEEDSWDAGLAAWRQEQYDVAAAHFERAAVDPRASSWEISAAAHWAARSHLRAHEPQKVSYWLRRAAEYPRTFYGIISIKALGMEQSRFNWELPALDDKMVKVLSATAEGKRALALMDARRPAWAETELRLMDPGNDKIAQEAMMALAHAAGAPAFEMRLGSGLHDAGGRLYDAALYPDAPWPPEDGYVVDKALVHAFMRQESRFEQEAVNKSSGATGLMQLLPSTAMLMVKQHKLKVSREQIGEPAVNMRLGQKYLDGLLKIVDGNLFKLAVAYNAGPGKLARWEKEITYGDDSLLFIESLPAAETRVFLEKVLTNYWIYRIKYGQDTNSLEAVAAGTWPMYAATPRE